MTLLTAIEIPPGIVSDVTDYTAGNRWVASDGIRFYDNQPERIGGNTLYQPIVAASSTIHGLVVWGTLGGTILTGYACETAFYVCDGTNVYDTTPILYTYTNPTITTTAGYMAFLMTTNGTNTPAVGDYMTVSGHVGAIGGIPEAEINGTHVVTTISGGVMTFDTVTPATSSTSGPATGVTVTARVLFNTSIIGGSVGFGQGNFGGSAGAGFGTFGFGGANATVVGSGGLYLWSYDIFGEYLIYTSRGGAIYVWQPASPNDSAQTLDELGATDGPLYANFVLMSDKSRQLIVLGTNDTGSAVFDPMLVRWSDIESLTSWTPTTINQAGSIRLTEGSVIVAGVRTRQDILIFTNTALYALSYIGAPEVFSLRPLATNMSVVGPNAIVADDDIVYWMASDGFYRFDGRVTRIPCPISRWVFDSFRTDNFKMNAIAGVNKAYQEIWFSFPTASDPEPSRTAVFNTASGAWSTLNFGRSAWATGGLVGAPIAAKGVRCVQHERGMTDFSTGVSTAITSYVQSGALELSGGSGRGNEFAFISKVLPDIHLPTTTSQAIFTLATRHDAGGGDSTNSTPTGTVIKTVTAFTPQLDVRARGRQFSIRVDGVGSDFWKLGTPRLAVRPDGRR